MFALPCLLALLACRSATPPERLPAPALEPAAEEPYRLGPGDVLRAGVYEHPELSTPIQSDLPGTRVDLEGNLSLPLLGPVPVAGLTLSEAHEQVTAAYAQYLLEPRVDLSIVSYGARRVHLYGEFQAPGAVVLDRPLTIYEGLSLGGGFTSGCDRDRIVHLRRQGEEWHARLIDGDSPESVGFEILRDGDLLFAMRSGAGRFSDEVLPYLSGVSATLGSVATTLLIEDRLDQ